MFRLSVRRTRPMILLASSVASLFLIASMGCVLLHAHHTTEGQAHEAAALAAPHAGCPDAGARLVHPKLPSQGWAEPSAAAEVSLPLQFPRGVIPAREEVHRPQAFLPPSPVRGPPLHSDA